MVGVQVPKRRWDSATPEPRATRCLPCALSEHPLSISRLGVGGAIGSQHAGVGAPHPRVLPGLCGPEVAPQSEPQLHVRPERRPCLLYFH